MAQKIFNSRTVTTDSKGNERSKLVVLFTDGVPTVSLDADREYGASQDASIREEYYSGLSGVEDAVNKADELKKAGIQIYTIGTSGLDAMAGHEYKNGTEDNPYVDPEFKSIDGHDFLAYVSSNYQGVTSWHDAWYFNEKADDLDDPDRKNDDGTLRTDNTYLGGSVLHFYQERLDKNGEVVKDSDGSVIKDDITDSKGTATATTYAKTAADGNFSVAFELIMQSVSTPNVSLTDKAVLKEVLSDYFDLNAVDKSEIKVYVEPYAGVDDTGTHTFGERQLASTAGFEISVTLENADRNTEGKTDVVVNVSGFSYSQHYVRQDPITKEILGYKLIVEVPIKTRPGFWGGNNVPTNKETTAIYNEDGEEVQDFPMPEVNVPMDPKVTTNDHVIYYADGSIKATDVLKQITVDNKPVTVTYDELNSEYVFEPEASWMDDYADMNWSAGSNTTTSEIDNKNPKKYEFGVTLTPNKDSDGNDRLGDENMSVNGSNIVGDPVSTSGKSASSIGSVEILVPVITFKDSTIQIGDKTDKQYYNTTNLVDDIKWVNMNSPYDQDGKAIEAGPSDPTDVEPKLSFEYSPEGVGENYFMKDTAVDVTVKIGDMDLTGKSYFEWVVCDSSLHDEAEIKNHKGDVDSKEFWIHVKPITMDADAVVIDFGIGVDIDVLFNDVLYGDGKVVGVMYGDLPTEVYTKTLDSNFVSELTATSNHGGVTITKEGKVRYLSDDMQMPTSEKFVYAVKYENGEAVLYYYSTVTVIPATTIYYEDNFVDFSVSGTDTTSGWEDVYTDATITDFSEVVQSEDRVGTGNIYGYDEAYEDMTKYSLGAAQMITVNANRTGTMKFKFWGTGFDVISRTTSDTGTILVRVYKLDENGVRVDNYTDTAAIDPYKSYFVNTYYGYDYSLYKVTYLYQNGKWNRSVGSKAADDAVATEADFPDNPSENAEVSAIEYCWVATNSGGEGLYQVPVIKAENLTYGNYEVEITCSYAPLFDTNKTDDSYDFYLDAIRIYDPAGRDNLNATIKDAYIKDQEYLPTYEELRDLVISANDFEASTEGQQMNGVIFIDSGKNGVSISDYTNYGPNNELYLAPGQSVAFKLDKSNAQAVHLALKSVGGIGKVKIYDANSGVNQADVSDTVISTATDLYHDISGLKNGSVVVIYNSGSGNDAIVSITNIKTTYSESGSGEEGQSFSMDRSAAAVALNSLKVAAPVLKPSYPTLDFDEEIRYNIYFNAENVEGLSLGDMGLLTWYTKPETVSVDNAEYVISGAYFNEADGDYMVHSQGIPAKNLADELYFVVYAKLADGSYVYSEMYSYNAKAYAEDRLVNSNSEKTQALCVAMLNYGAAAQTQFGYKADELMNADLTAEQLALVGGYDASMIESVVGVDSSKTGAFAATSGGFTKMEPSVSFEGAFAINYYFTPANVPDGEMKLYCWDLATYNSAAELTAENAIAIKTMTAENGQYVAAYTDIAAKQIDETVFVCGVYESNGVRYCTGVLAYSLGAYCQDRIENGSETMRGFAEATAAYGYFAKEYFGIQ